MPRRKFLSSGGPWDRPTNAERRSSGKSNTDGDKPRRYLRGSIRQLIKRVWQRADDHNDLDLAAQMSYYFALSLFPFLLLVAAIVGMLPFSGLWHQVLGWMTTSLPDGTRAFVYQTIIQLTENRNKFFTVGLIGTAWAASMGLMNLTYALNLVFNVQETRSYFRRTALALAMVLVLALVFLAAFVLVSLGGRLDHAVAERLGLAGSLMGLWPTARRILSLVLIGTGVSLLEYVLPNTKRKWRWMTAGTIFVVLAWAPVTLGFDYYIRYFTHYDRTYGALSAFVILMLWIYLLSLTALLGAELNSELENGRPQTGSAGATGRTLPFRPRP